jgi:hypothetical protein
MLHNMKNPATETPGSGPTIAAPQAHPDAAFGREPATGRFIGSDGAGRSVAEQRVITDRRARVKSLYPEKTYAEIGAELGWATPTIYQDARALGLTGQRRAGARRKYPEPQERECANPDCDKRFTPASWEPDRRFHDIPCARAAQTTERVRERARELRTEWRRRAAAEIARLNAAGYLTARQLAAERKVTESTVSQWITRGLLKAERRIIENEPHQIVARSEFERFNVEEWPRICQRMGPGYPSNWSGARVRSWGGRLKLLDVRAPHKKGEAKAREVATAALQLLERKPDIRRRDALDALVVCFEGKHAVKLSDGQRRRGRDPEYRKARRKVERSLQHGFEVLGQPDELGFLLPG